MIRCSYDYRFRVDLTATVSKTYAAGEFVPQIPYSATPTKKNANRVGGLF